jgi:hypothetical protein
MGSNTGLGHSSILFMIECQVRYIMQCLAWLESGETGAVEVRPEVQDEYNRRLDQTRQSAVWKSKRRGGGCSSWYTHASGRNTAIWPGVASSYWTSMLRANRRDFLLIRGREAATLVKSPMRRAA